MPTAINTYIQSAKTHAAELASDLKMLSIDLATLALDPECLKEGRKLTAEQLTKEITRVDDLAKRIESMATEVGFLTKEISDHVGSRKWPEAMTEFRKQIKQKPQSTP